MATGTLEQRLVDLAQRIGNDKKALQMLLNGNMADLSALTTTNKTSLVAALNELKAAIAGASGINDAVTSTGSSWSSQKTQDSITSAINAVLNGAPAALDTLKELADLLTSDTTAIGTLTTALAKRVAVDQAQTFTSGEQAQARTNIGAQDAAGIGNTDRDLVAVYNAALV